MKGEKVELIEKNLKLCSIMKWLLDREHRTTTTTLSLVPETRPITVCCEKNHCTNPGYQPLSFALVMPFPPPSEKKDKKSSSRHICSVFALQFSCWITFLLLHFSLLAFMHSFSAHYNSFSLYLALTGALRKLDKATNNRIDGCPSSARCFLSICL